MFTDYSSWIKNGGPEKDLVVINNYLEEARAKIKTEDNTVSTDSLLLASIAGSLLVQTALQIEARYL